ncbi:MAG: DUF1761 domain-containing protein [Rhodoblastus sp.]
MQLPWLAIFAASAASWIFGALWYGVFGRAWAAGFGFSFDKPDGAQKKGPPVFALILSFVAEIAIAATLAGVLTHIAGAQFSMTSALVSGGFVWLGFIAPTLATNYAYQKRPWRIWAIDGGHWLGVAMLQAFTLARMA